MYGLDTFDGVLTVESSASAADRWQLECESIEGLHVYQHFASDSNPESGDLAIPEYFAF